MYTDEQIKGYATQLMQKGAPIEEIDRFIKMSKAQQSASPVNPLGTFGDVSNAIGKGTSDLLIGGVKGVAETAFGASQLGKGALDAIGRTVGINTDESYKQAGEQLKATVEPALEATNTMQQVGKVGEKIAEFALPAGAVGKATTAWPTLGKMVAQGLTAGTITAINKGKVDADTAWSAGTSAVLTGAFEEAGKLYSFLKGSKNPVDKLIKAGVSEQDANVIANQTNKGEVVKFLKTGLEKLKNPVEKPSVFNVASKQVGDFISVADKAKSKLGQTVDAAKQGLSGLQAETAPVKKTMYDLFNQFNIKLKKGIPDYTASEIKDVSAITNKIDDIFSIVKNNKVVDARRLEAITGQIDQVTGLLKSSGFKNNQVNTALSDLKSSINESVGNASEDFKVANKAYASFMDKYKAIKAAAKVPVSGGTSITNSEQILKRSLQTGDKKYNAAIKAMEELSKDFGLPKIDAKAITQTAYNAAAAESITKTAPRKSLEGMGQLGVGLIPDAKVQLVNKLWDGLKRQGNAKAIEDGVNKVIEVIKGIDSPQTNGLLDALDFISKAISSGTAPAINTAIALNK